eukprot:TRINITY_DN14594_c0_g1_i1.p1 TRINITY_DN14594_c0_g1~~TRINITY_DN14594_c0_g1_i1.p1  ORF type:complete len:117 (+),score=10.35 TRINITY_DN14594_c0_g1_i1:129-479(+)
MTKYRARKGQGGKALGPALLASVTLAGALRRGSMVILCTSGLSNVGLGLLDPITEGLRVFYKEVIQQALDEGVVISLITFKGEIAAVNVIGKLPDKTNGKICRVSQKAQRLNSSLF